MADSDSPFDAHKARKDRAWTARGPYDKLYADAYEFAVPQRRPGNSAQSLLKIDRLYDMTAPVSHFHFAGKLQQDLFPPGTAPMQLVPGAFPKLAVARKKLPPAAIDVLARELDATTQLINPFFTSGEWDNGVHEVCLDLGIGMGALYTAKGTVTNPVRFVSIPADDIAVECNLFGDVIGMYWRQHLARQAIDEHFPDGKFPADWKNSLRSAGGEAVQLYQDFVQHPKTGRWEFCAYVNESKEPIARNSFRTRPIATPRYYRVPGEAYGRGPLLLAMPSIKTLNKAQELALKAAAIQMLGIWGYRAGGSFNPDTVRVGPGEFWPMMATGGILGADVQRLDPASGRMDVASMVIGSLRDDVKAVLLDNRIPPLDGTPESASAIMARLAQKREAHVGAFGRLTREIMPVVVPRMIEILSDFGYMNPVAIDELLVSIEVLSPMAQAMKADRLTPILSYIQVVDALLGPAARPLFVKMEETLDRIATDTHVPVDLLPNEDERNAEKKRQSEEAAAQQALALAAAAAGAKPAGANGNAAMPMAV